LAGRFNWLRHYQNPTNVATRHKPSILAIPAAPRSDRH
jgi:hypothetical protein